MKMIKRALSLLMALALTLCAAGAAAEATIVATVNGETLTVTDYMAVESAFLYQYQAAGVNLQDPQVYAYVQDLALTYAIEQMLVVQDMHAQGCFTLDAEAEAWCAEQGHAAWEKALADVGEMLRETLELPEGTDMSQHALSYAEKLGVTEQTYVDEYRMQLAMVNYQSWLLGGEGVTEEAVQAAYEQRVAQSEALYANDAAAFEQAMYAGKEVWYMPQGYRRVLQILLPVEGDTDEARLANAQEQIAEIDARLAAGESFVSLIPLYGADANFSDPAFFEVGYSVHPDSIMWEDVFVKATFAPEMAAPGCWSQPFASKLGVHILYYLADVPGGPVALSEDVYDLLAAVVYEELTTKAMADRLDVLAEEAEIVIH